MNSELYDPTTFQAIGTERFEPGQLPNEAQTVMNDLGVPYRFKRILAGEDTESGQQFDVKFATMNLYPDNRRVNPGAPEACYQNDIIGVRWGGAADGKDHSELDAEAYTQLVFDRYGGDDSNPENDFAYFALWLSPGDVVVTKNLGPVAKYARVTSSIKHRNQSDAEEELKKHDIGFYREVEWVDVSPADAPAKVLSTTCRGTVTLPELDKVAMEQIVDQFDAPISDVDYEVDDDDLESVFSSLASTPTPDKPNANLLIDSLSASGSHNGLETAVCTYIQDRTGAVMHPSSRSYPGIESIFRTTGDNGPETYGVQVKRGSFSKPERLEEFADNHEQLFLYSSAGDTIEHDRTENIGEDDLTAYLIASPSDLPPVEIDRILRTHAYLNK